MKLELYQEKIFDNIKHIDEFGGEYWEARELAKALKYVEWRKFKSVIDKAMITCEISNYNVKDHFGGAAKMIEIAKGGKRKVEDYKLSRYACYLIVQNADSRKQEVALGQTYFAMKTRQMELLEENNKQLTEDQKRLKLRYEIKNSNKHLNKKLYKIGARTDEEFAEFHNEGYKGLYNGETAKDIAKRKNINENDEILDFMGNAELAANEFRITQTDLLLKKENTNLPEANNIHYEVGSKVRDAMINISEIAPEDLPTPEKSISELEQEELKQINGGSFLQIVYN